MATTKDNSYGGRLKSIERRLTALEKHPSITGVHDGIQFKWTTISVAPCDYEDSGSGDIPLLKCPSTQKGEVTMDFRIAVLQASKSAKLNARQRAKLDSVTDERHPMFWRAAEAVTARRYERETGRKPPMKAGSIDWAKIMDWLVANLPAIIKMIMVIFGL